MALTKTQGIVIKTLASSPLRSRFYWTGGTLLAERYLHHRQSEDIDFFTDTPFIYEEVFPLAKQIQKTAKLTFLEDKKVFDRWEFFIHNHRKLRVEFVHYQFPKLHRRTLWRGVYIDSLKDLAANKIMALIDRRDPKDVVDLYFLIQKVKYSPKKLLKLAEKKFGIKTDALILLSEALVACRRLDEVEPLLFGKSKKQTLKDVKNYFEAQSAQYIHYQWR